jgi:hypothetical protein
MYQKGGNQKELNNKNKRQKILCFKPMLNGDIGACFHLLTRWRSCPFKIKLLLPHGGGGSCILIDCTAALLLLN